MGHRAPTRRHQPRRGAPSLGETVIKHHRDRYLRDEINAWEFEEKVEEAMRDPRRAYDALRPLGSPMFLPFPTETIER